VKTWSLLLLLVAVGLLTPRAFAAADGLCGHRETKYFSCPTSNQKWISICGAQAGLIQYRFGRKDRVELAFPTLESTKDALKFAHYSRYQTDRLEIAFLIQSVRYSVFDYIEHGRRSAGVRVTRPGQPEVTIPCAGNIQSALFRLEAKLPCDSESVLNMGDCPIQGGAKR
jgi:hypothetical protein